MFFTLSTTDGLRRYPADFQHHWTLLFYYAGDFLPVSATELWGLAELAGEFRQNDCQLLCISPDSVAVHLAFLENLSRHRAPAVSFPLGADPEGLLRKKLQLDPEKKYIWLLSPGGRSEALFSYPHQTGANFTEVLRTLLALRLDKPTPYGWVPGASALCLPPTTHAESRYFLAAKEKEGAIGIDWYLCYENED